MKVKGVDIFPNLRRMFGHDSSEWVPFCGRSRFRSRSRFDVVAESALTFWRSDNLCSSGPSENLLLVSKPWRGALVTRGHKLGWSNEWQIMSCFWPKRMDKCGVTREPLTYWSLAMRHTSWSKFLFGTRPRLKWVITALMTWGWVFPSPWALTSIASFLAIFFLRKLKRSNSTTVMGWLDAMTERENLEGSRDHPWGGGNAG